jgi:hypothetical protein
VLQAVRQRSEKLQTSREVIDCFHVRRALDRSLPGILPIRQGLLYETRLTVVMRQQLGLSFDGLREPRFYRARDLFVIPLPRALEQRLVGRILDQRMLEHIARPWWLATLVEELGVDQLGKRLP